MSEQVLHHKVKISMSWIYNNQETEIVSESIKSVVLDYDYDSYNMPIIYASINIKSALYNDIEKNKDNAKVFLNIQKYNVVEDGGAVVDDIKEQFKYFMSDNVDYNSSLNDDFEQGTGTESESYIYTTLGLAKEDIIADNKHEFGGIFQEINKSTLAYLGLEHMKKVCIKKFDENEDFDVMIIPQINTVTAYLAHINNNIKALYKTRYRYFHDFDIAYLLDESGEYIDNGEGEYETVMINVSDTILDESKNLGIVADTSNSMYVLYVDANDSGITMNKAGNESVNSAVLVDEDGNTKKIGINDDVVEKDDDTDVTSKTEYVRTGQTDNKYMEQNYSSNFQTYAQKDNNYIQFSRLQLDQGIITPNKEYKVVHYESGSNYNGTYILVSKKTIFQLQDGEYIPTTNIVLRRKIAPQV